MENWQKNIIVKAAKELEAKEKRLFTTAYTHYPEKYHGYIQSLVQNEKVFNSLVDAKELGALAAENGFSVKLSAFNNAVYVGYQQPYFGIDGCIAMAYDECIEAREANKDDINKVIKVELGVGEINGYMFLRAKVVTPRGETEGLADLTVEENKKGVKSLSFEIASSLAVRKALSYQGFTRMPIHFTDYGEDKTIKRIRELLAEDNK